MADDRTQSKLKTAAFVFSFVHSLAFIVVSVLQFDAFEDIQTLDINLKDKIQNFYDSNTGNDENHEPEVVSRRYERASNFIADILAAQEQALAKHCINPNHPCSTGIQGAAGLDGDRGFKGSKGDSGQPGSKGNPGKRGPVGDTGDKGQTGDKGPQGQKGHKGPLGKKGSSGIPGLRGQKGEKGTAGVDGIPGSTGVIGGYGTKGEQGDIGEKGDQGPPGELGSKGMKGDPGPQGPQGNDTKMLPDGCKCFPLPSFSGQNPEIMYIQEGETKSLPCTATGQPTPVLSVQKLATSKRDDTFTKRVLQKQQGVYTINNAGPNDYGRYICTATNRNGKTEKIVTAMKGSMPLITTHPLDVQLAVGHQINFECQAAGQPKPGIEYYKDGVKVASDATHLLNGGSFVLTSPTVADAGTYECRATNAVGTVSSLKWHIKRV